MTLQRKYGFHLLFLVWLGCVSVLGNAQTCTDNLVKIADDRFTDQEDGTVYDTQTGLLWMRCAYGTEWKTGQCKENPLLVSWSDSLTLAGEQTFAGYVDWQLPNVNELQSLVEWACVNPAINTTAFASVNGGRYWSSTARQVVGDSTKGVVLTVDFFNGRIRDESLNSGYVLFVRHPE